MCCSITEKKAKNQITVLESRIDSTLQCCSRLAVNKMSKYLQYETRDRKPNERDLWDLHRLRIEGAATELDYDSWNMREALTRKV